MADDLYLRLALGRPDLVAAVGPLARRAPGSALTGKVLGRSKAPALGVRVAPAGNVVGNARREGRAAFVMPGEAASFDDTTTLQLGYDFELRSQPPPTNGVMAVTSEMAARALGRAMAEERRARNAQKRRRKASK